MHIERAARGVWYVLLNVCVVAGCRLYHLRVNVAEGDIRCETGEASRRLGFGLRCVGMNQGQM